MQFPRTESKLRAAKNTLLNPAPESDFKTGHGIALRESFSQLNLALRKSRHVAMSANKRGNVNRRILLKNEPQPFEAFLKIDYVVIRMKDNLRLTMGNSIISIIGLPDAVKPEDFDVKARGKLRRHGRILMVLPADDIRDAIRRRQNHLCHSPDAFRPMSCNGKVKTWQLSVHSKNQENDGPQRGYRYV